MLFDILVNGLVVSSIYATLAAGFSLIFGVTKVPNMAYTAFYMLSAYGVLLGVSTLKLPLAVAICGAVALAVAAGVLAFLLLFDRVREHDNTVMIISVGLALLIQEIVLLVSGGHTRGVPPIVSGFVDIGSNRVSSQHLLVVGVSLAMLVALRVLLTKTRLGKAIRAVSQDREAAGLMGINVQLMLICVMALSAGLAGIAGAVVAPVYMLSPSMWIQPLTIVLASVVIGGLGSIGGGVLGAFILGYTETIVSFVLPGGAFLKGAVAMVIMITVLLIRPEGLFGVAFEEERL
jgi:branched-chain amino acid transport system permease protein